MWESHQAGRTVFPVRSMVLSACISGSLSIGPKSAITSSSISSQASFITGNSAISEPETFSTEVSLTWTSSCIYVNSNFINSFLSDISGASEADQIMIKACEVKIKKYN